jgi:hypothetical protein
MPDEKAPEAFDASTLDDEALRTEYTRVKDRGVELSSKESLTAEEISELAELASKVDTVKTEIDSRDARAAELASTREKFGQLPELVTPEAAPVADVVEPTSVQKAEEPVAVAVPSVSDLAAKAPQMPVKSTPKGVTAYVSSDAAGFAGKRAGDTFDGLTEISEALINSAQQYGRSGGGAGSRHAIAQFTRDRGEEFTVSRDEDGYKVLQHARDEKRLHGGSLAKQWQHNVDQGNALVAAAGWCAPSENDYDLCRLWSGMTGLIDLPTITVRRGGINYTAEPSFAAIYANAVAAGGGSNFLTEAQVIADTAKTCSELPCPTFTNRRLDVLALCVRVSFLQAAGYPELVNLWTDGLLAANAQEMNRLIIAAMVTQAGAATTLAPLAAGEADSFTSAVLAAVELAAEDIRYQQMMDPNATIEIVLPHWILPQIRADLSRRTGVDLLSVADSDIARMFSVRNVRVQFVRGYQDGLITGGALDPTFPGGDATPAYMTALPSTVNFLAYPAGAVAVARQDVVTLTNVYDAASLATNEFTALFAEEGFAPIFPCPGLRAYTVAGCVGGITGAAQINCSAT